MTKKEISEAHGRKYVVFANGCQIDFAFATLREAIRCAEKHNAEIWRAGRRVA